MERAAVRVALTPAACPPGGRTTCRWSCCSTGQVGGAAPQLGDDAGRAPGGPCRTRRGWRCPWRRPGRRAARRSQPSGSSPRRIRSNRAARSGLAARQAPDALVPRRRARPRRARDPRVCARTSSATSKVCSGSKPRSAWWRRPRRAERRAVRLPVFCAFGAGQAMIVRRTMKVGVGHGLGRLDRRVQGVDVLVVRRPCRRCCASRRLHVPAVRLVALAACPRRTRSSVSPSMEMWLSS